MRTGADFFGVIAFVVLLSPQTADKSPADFFRTHEKQIASLTYTYAGSPNVKTIAEDVGDYLASSTAPWASADAGAVRSELPLIWTGRTFAVKRDRLPTTPDSVTYFTGLFLRHYEKLPADIHDTGSVIAVGAATLATLEDTYHTNWAYLPPELRDPVALTQLLVLKNAQLIKTIYGLDGTSAEQRRAAVTTALSSVCGSQSNPVRLTQAAFLAPGTAGDTLRGQVTALRKACTGSASAFAQVNNLTIRAWLLEAVPETERAALVDQLLSGLENEQTAVRHAKGVAPDYRVAFTRSDPTVLVPLLVTTADVALRSKDSALQPIVRGLASKNENDAALEASLGATLMAALRENALTRRVLNLAGSDPDIEILRPEAGQVQVRLIWQRIARVERRIGDVPRPMERVAVDLVKSQNGPGTDSANSRAGGGAGGQSQGAASGGGGDGNAGGSAGGGRGSGGDGDGNGPGRGRGVGGTGQVVGERIGVVVPPPEPPAQITPMPEKAAPPRGVDRIAVPANGRAELARRTVEIQRECRGAALRLPSTSTILSYFDNGWDNRRDISTWLTTTCDELLTQRTHFLNEEGGPFASRLPSVLRDEAYMAAWLHETGAVGASRLLLQDVVELAIYAASERGHEAERIRQLDLPVTLAIPVIVGGPEYATDGRWMTVSTPTRQVLDASATGRHAGFARNDQVSLDDLFTFWTQSDGAAGNPFLSAISGVKSPLAESGRGCTYDRLCRWLFLARAR